VDGVLTGGAVIVAAAAGAALVAIILLDVFETIVLPRRVTHRFRLATLTYQLMWRPVRALAVRLRRDLADSILAFFGPGSLLLLLTLWLVGLIVGFATLQHIAEPARHRRPVGTDLYFSGTTLLTLGLGDVTPVTGWARFMTVFEVGTGFGVLALVIGYLPALYQATSRREVAVVLLDARAGSPPTGTELLRRHAERSENLDAAAVRLTQYLAAWELWAAELLESHLSYPVLAYFRSQHDNQSWVAALTAMLDTCALLLIRPPGCPELTGQARLTYAICRHAVVDLCQVLHAPPLPPEKDRLPPSLFAGIVATLDAVGLTLRDDEAAYAKLSHLRATYEPYVNALANRLLIELPPWLPAESAADNWRTTEWEPRPRGPLL